MQFASRFVPVAGEVGLLSMLTLFSFFATFFALAASFVFFLAAQKRVAPEHCTGMEPGHPNLRRAVSRPARRTAFAPSFRHTERAAQHLHKGATSGPRGLRTSGPRRSPHLLGAVGARSRRTGRAR